MQLSDGIHAFIWNSMTANNCNTYLIDGPTRVLIDPGHIGLFDHVREGLSNLGLDLADIGLVICTHAHPDHIEAIQLFKDVPTLTTFHETEWSLVSAMRKQVSALYGVDVNAFQPDFFLREGDLAVNGVRLSVLHTPGHSPGSICIHWPEQKALFTGDLIFKEGLGRTDLPGGNSEELKKSILGLADLDVQTVLPGHGDFISGAKDVKANFEHLKHYWFSHI